ncbi:MAG TPA: DUF4162 domain-containing protein, partial [Solirubrobacterales bacterium]|nr:DUF4162 domain-containing protein [Solirubrobacterales bacterium]
QLVEGGTTLLLTTQYLEEADQLANRVGIIDAGKIAAEGTPAALKAEIGRPSVEVLPVDPARRKEAEDILLRFGSAVPAAGEALSVRLNEGIEELAAIVRSFDSAGIELASLGLNEPTLDDVFLAKTGRHLEGAGEAESAEMPLPASDPDEQAGPA